MMLSRAAQSPNMEPKQNLTGKQAESYKAPCSGIFLCCLQRCLGEQVNIAVCLFWAPLSLTRADYSRPFIRPILSLNSEEVTNMENMFQLEITSKYQKVFCNSFLASSDEFLTGSPFKIWLIWQALFKTASSCLSLCISDNHIQIWLNLLVKMC